MRARRQVNLTGKSQACRLVLLVLTPHQANDTCAILGAELTTSSMHAMASAASRQAGAYRLDGNTSLVAMNAYRIDMVLQSLQQAIDQCLEHGLLHHRVAGQCDGIEERRCKLRATETDGPSTNASCRFLARNDRKVQMSRYMRLLVGNFGTMLHERFGEASCLFSKLLAKGAGLLRTDKYRRFAARDDPRENGDAYLAMQLLEGYVPHSQHPRDSGRQFAIELVTTSERRYKLTS